LLENLCAMCWGLRPHDPQLFAVNRQKRQLTYNACRRYVPTVGGTCLLGTELPTRCMLILEPKRNRLIKLYQQDWYIVVAFHVLDLLEETPRNKGLKKVASVDCFALDTDLIAKNIITDCQLHRNKPKSSLSQVNWRQTRKLSRVNNDYVPLLWLLHDDFIAALSRCLNSQFFGIICIVFYLNT
jgi:hypothetical protein